MKTDNSPIAFSYIRFSTPDQAKGDSLRRQTEAAAAWCERHGARLDESTTLHDLGKSAYLGEHRKNPARYALAGFLKLVEDGKIPRGSYLVIENLDRLSREHIQPALLLALNLLQAGVRIVQLKPAEMVFDDKSDTLPVMMMMMELSRGHGESAIKSERVGAAWAEKKKKAREEGKVLTHALPAWVEERGGKLHLVPERAAVVKHIFALAAGGYGLTTICKRLTADKVPPFGASVLRPGKKRPAFSGRWTIPYLDRILTDRRAVGEYQPCGRGRKPDGPAIADYFPAAVTEDEYWAARAGAEQRRAKKTRVGKYVNIFAGLLKNARDGDAYFPASKSTRVLINAASVDGRTRCLSFPAEVFERAVLDRLAEIDAHEILNGDGGPDESLSLAGELAGVEAKIAELEAELLNGDVAALAKVLRQQEERKRELAAKLADARQKAAHPLSEAWGSAQSLLKVLDDAPDPDDVRLRLRAAIRRIVDSVWMIVVPRGRDRLCVAQIWFAGGKKHRDYLIFHRAAGNRRKGDWSVNSLAMPAVPGKLDLRKIADAARLEAALLRIPTADLSGAARPAVE